MSLFKENVEQFLIELNQFQYKFDGSDRIWTVIFPHKKTLWHKLSATLYRETYYITLVDKRICLLEVIPGKKIVANTTFSSSDFGYRGEEDLEKTWGIYIESVLSWFKKVRRDWIKANAFVMANYPLNCRMGYVPNAIVRASCKDIYRLDKELGTKTVSKFIKIAESHYFSDREKTYCTSMTARRFFEYCKIAYIAAQEKNQNIDEKLSGLELYKRYADGRDEGLTAIDLDSESEFADWLDHKHPSRSFGGHPWEIKRGGNTTHIGLFVMRPQVYNDKFMVSVGAHAITRLAEAIRMFLALYDAKLPITIARYESISRRLLAQDNIGIIPQYGSLHRGNQNFTEHQDVHDVTYFDDFGKQKRRIKQFITWEPLPMLVPKDQMLI